MTMIVVEQLSHVKELYEVNYMLYQKFMSKIATNN